MTAVIVTSDLALPIADGDSIDQIRLHSRVADRTVVLDSHRYGLFHEHRRRDPGRRRNR